MMPVYGTSMFGLVCHWIDLNILKVVTFIVLVSFCFLFVILAVDTLPAPAVELFLLFYGQGLKV